MDMCRKFLQMGMTRSLRYANFRGGRKYDGDGGVKGREGEEWEGRREKEEAGKVFREVWERVKGREGYVRAKGEFLGRQRRWDKEEMERRRKGDGGEGDEVGFGDGSKDGDGGKGGRGLEGGGCKSKSKSRKRKADEGRDDEEKEMLRDGVQDGDNFGNGRGQEEGRRRSKRRKGK